MKSDEDRGPEAAWLRRERKNRQWKEGPTRERLEAANPGVSFASYRDIEAGNRKLTEDQRIAVARVFGQIPDFTPVSTGTPDLAALIRESILATKANTIAFEKLAASIDAAAAKVTVRVEDVASTIEALVSVVPALQPTNGDETRSSTGGR